MKFAFIVHENVRDTSFWRVVVCAMLATAVLVFIGCGSEMLNVPGAILTTSSDTIRVALAFGFAVNILIKTFGPVSGCHINPVVTIAFMVIGKVSLVRTVCYALAQFIGAIVGAALLFGFKPSEADRVFLGAPTLKNGITAVQGFGVEATLTFILVLAISACLDDKRIDHGKMRITNPLTIGFTVSALHLAGIPFTGCAINPARALAPAIIMAHWTDYHWIYWAGPLVGACLSSSVYHFIVATQNNKPPLSQSSHAMMQKMRSISTTSMSSQVVQVPIEAYSNNNCSVDLSYIVMEAASDIKK